VERRASDNGLGVVLKGEAILSKDDDDQILDLEVCRVHFITEAGAFDRSCSGTEGMAVLAVNGDFVLGMTLTEIIGLVKGAGDTFIIKLCPFAHLLDPVKKVVSRVRLQDAAELAKCADAAVESQARAVEAQLKAQGMFEQIKEGAEAGPVAWETPVKEVSKENFVAPISAAKKETKKRLSASMNGDMTCVGCGVGKKSVVFGCGHCVCQLCSEKCHACPVRSCGRIILTRSKLDLRFRSKLDEQARRGQGLGEALNDMDTGYEMTLAARTPAAVDAGIQMQPISPVAPTGVHTGTGATVERGVLAGRWSAPALGGGGGGSADAPHEVAAVEMVDRVAGKSRRARSRPRLAPVEPWVDDGAEDI